MANDFDKIFGDSVPAKGTESPDIDSQDEVVGEIFVPETASDKTAINNYFRDIFGEDVSNEEFGEEDFDPDTVWVKDENGKLTKKNEEELEETESTLSENIDEADEIEEIVGKKKKNNKKKPKKPLPNKASVREEVFERSLNNENTASAASAERPDVSAPAEKGTEPGDRSIDETVVNSVDKIRKTPLKKPISEMSEQEIRELSPDQLHSLSASERKELFERFDDSKVLDEKEQITGIPENIRENTVFENENSPDAVRETPSAVSKTPESSEFNKPSSVEEQADNTPEIFETPLDENKSPENTNSNHSADFVSKSDEPVPDTSYEHKRNYPETHSVSEAFSENSEYRSQNEAKTPASERFNDEVYPIIERAENAPESRTEPTESESFDANADTVYRDASDTDKSRGYNSEKNEEQFYQKISETETAVSDTAEENTGDTYRERPAESCSSYSAAEKSDAEIRDGSPVVLYEDGEKDRSRFDTLKPFTAESYAEDLKKYTGGYALKIEETQNSFVITTPAEESYVLDKSTGTVSGVDNGSVLGQIIGKTYSRYEPAKNFSEEPSDAYVPTKPVKQDSWSVDELVKEIDEKYGKTSVSVNENEHIVLSVNEGNPNGFTVELNKSHFPVNIGVYAAAGKSVAEEAKNDIIQYNQTVAANDNAVYFQEKFEYDKYIREKNPDAAFNDTAAVYSTAAGYNPNGETKAIGNGYNVSFVSRDAANAGINHANPYRSSGTASVAAATNYQSVNLFAEREILPSSEKVNQYIEKIYSEEKDFTKKKEADKNYSAPRSEPQEFHFDTTPEAFPFFDKRLYRREEVVSGQSGGLNADSSYIFSAPLNSPDKKSGENSEEMSAHTSRYENSEYTQSDSEEPSGWTSISGFGKTAESSGVGPKDGDFGHKNDEDTPLKENVPDYESVITPAFDANVYYNSNALTVSVRALSGVSRRLYRPAFNLAKDTLLSNDVAQGARTVTKYTRMPFFIGANLAARNIWRQSNTSRLLKERVKTSKIIVNQAWNSGVSFRSSRIASYDDYLNFGKRLNHRGRQLGLSKLTNMSYGEISASYAAFKRSTIIVGERTVDLATAKSIYRHLGASAPKEVADMVQTSAAFNTALSYAKLTDGVGGYILHNLQNKGILGNAKDYDLTKMRDIMRVQTLLRKYAESNGRGFLFQMSKKQLRNWIATHSGDKFLWIAKSLSILKELEGKARRLDRLKFSRLFSVIEFLRNITGNNEVVQGAMMLYRAYNSTLTAVKATIRFTTLAKRSFKHTFAGLGRILHIPQTYRWFHGHIAGWYEHSSAKTAVNAAKKAGTATAKKFGTTKVGQMGKKARKEAIKAKRKARRAWSKAKSFRSRLTTKGKATKSLFKKAFRPPKWLKAAGKVLGKIFLGVMLGVAIFVVTTAAINFVLQLVIASSKYLSIFLDDEDKYNKAVQKVYDEVSELDDSFYSDMCDSGETYNTDGNNLGYFDLNEGSQQNASGDYFFSLYPMTSTGDSSAPEGSLNQIGYEYHLYDRVLDGSVAAEDIAGIKEIPFQSNAAELLSMANVVCFDEAYGDKIKVKNAKDRSKTEEVDAEDLMKDYCYKGEYFYSLEGKNENHTTLWTATHGFYVRSSEVYSCNDGCETYKYSCGEFEAKTNSDNGYRTVSLTAVPDTQLLYKYYNSNSPYLKLKGGLYGDKTGESRAVTINGTTYHTGCKQHAEKSSVSKYTKTYYCGQYHEGAFGQLVKCCEENANKIGVGHKKTVYKLKDCSEQICVWKDEKVTVQNISECNAKATFCNFTEIYNAQKKGTSNFQQNIAENVTSYNNTQLYSGGKKVDGWHFNGWVYISVDKNDSSVAEMKKLLQAKCSDLQYTVQEIYIDGLTIPFYLHIFYCPGHASCSESSHSSGHSQYDMHKVKMTWNATGSNGVKYSFNFNVNLRKNCESHKVENKTVTVNLPQEFKCVGYCDGNHSVKYCHGHFNNCVEGYIVKSMNNTFSFRCSNNECEMYNVRVDDATDNKCKECGLRGLIYYDSGLDTTSIFYADLMYGPSSLGLLPHWGTVYPSDKTNFIANGWLSRDAGANRMNLAIAKASVNWYDTYGITPSKVYSGALLANQVNYFYSLTRLEDNTYSVSDRDFRSKMVNTALKSVGVIPYYVGPNNNGGIASNIGYIGNNFGELASKKDYRGRSFNGLNNTGWTVWVYDTAKENKTVPLSTKYTAGKDGYLKFDKDNIRPGDIVVMSVKDKIPQSFGIYIGQDVVDDSKYVVVEMCDDSVNNVVVKYVKKSAFEGYIPLGSFQTAFKTTAVS